MADDPRTLFDIPFGRRLGAIRKLLTKQRPYALLAIKPADMMLPRGPDYVIGPVKSAIDAETDLIRATIAAVEPLAAECDNRMREGELDDSPAYFHGADARYAYAFVRHFQPPQIVEVGSGQSTHIMKAALQKNGSGVINCIDPQPRRDVAAVADTIFYESVLRAAPGIFQNLKAGDFLFIDGSHHVFNGTDATYLFLEVLPLLAPGVIVHIHDIHLPNDYPEGQTKALYNEQYLLGALVLNRNEWETLLPVDYAARRGWITATGYHGSFWMRKKA